MLLKLEILLLFISFLYILYFLGEKIFLKYSRPKKIITRTEKKELEITKEVTPKASIKKEKEFTPLVEEKKNLTIEEKNYIADIIKRVENNSTKGYFEASKGLIVEGLAIDKKNKALNLALANIYEKEKKYENAEYIYSDLLEIYKDDIEIMKKLGFVYALQSKLHKSFEIYELIHKKNVGDDSVIEMLSDITFNIGYYEKAVKYINMFLKSKPRNVEKMAMKAVSYEKLKNYDDAIKIHKDILELQPYNTFSRDKIRELESYI